MEGMREAGQSAWSNAPMRDSEVLAPARRNAIVFEGIEFDTVIGPDHPARVVWSYVQRVDLLGIQAWIRAGAHSPGQPPPDPRVVIALWLYACIEGVGSARQLERLSEWHCGFRWLRAGVPLNHHLLSDFRWQAPVVVDRLLTHSVATLWSRGLVSLVSMNHDNIRIRVSPDTSSFRRMTTLERLLGEVEERIARLRQEIDADPNVLNRHLRAARDRALREW